MRRIAMERFGTQWRSIEDKVTGQFGRKVLCVRRTATVATHENPSAGTVAFNHPVADRTHRLK
jgi:hypothetical protein